MDWLSYARDLDKADPIAEFRSRFVVSDSDLVYLDGNSLGRMPVAASAKMRSLEAEWGDRLVRGWNEGWMDLSRRLGDKIGRLIGAREGEVLVADSTSVNLYKLAWAALNEGGRARGPILTDDLNFPSDHYVFQGLGQVRVLATDGIHPPEPEIPPHVGLASFSAVAFKSGALYPVEAFTSAAHDAGCRILWDLSHAVGAVELHLADWSVDLAVGCTYKFLNGGPGSPAFLYVRQDLQDALAQPIQGWFGRENAFDFGLEYRPAQGIGRFASGTPPIVSLALIEPGVDLLIEAGLDRLTVKSRAMGEFLARLFDERLESLGFRLNSPRSPEARGSHVAFGHEHAWQMCQALIDTAGVVPDFRAPDTIRFACVPLYGTFEELFLGVERLATIAETGTFRAFPTKAEGTVT